MHRRPRVVLLIVALALSLPLTTFAARPDAWITMKAKSALYLAPDVHGLDINVDTINGRVSLYGTVGNETEKRRAEDEVRKIEGVTDVNNMLKVGTKNASSDNKGAGTSGSTSGYGSTSGSGTTGSVGTGGQGRGQVSDESIKQDINRALKADHALEDSDIQVKSVESGVVTLSGRAATPSDNLRALRIARGQPGVVRLSSEVQVPDTYSDDDFRTDSGTMGSGSHQSGQTGTASADRSTSAVASDMWITSATKMKLAADSRTPATEINVDTYDSTVTLFGMVPSQQAKQAATEIARSVNGVKQVNNELQVVASSKQKNVQAKDEQIKDEVQKALKDRGAQDNASIGVEVSNGVVRLTGTVPTWEKGLSAVYAARGVPGVRSVRNEMKVNTDHAS